VRHLFDLGRHVVLRYFRVFDECAQVARLKLLTWQGKPMAASHWHVFSQRGL